MAFKYPAARRDESKVGGGSSARGGYVSVGEPGEEGGGGGGDGQYRSVGFGQGRSQSLVWSFNEKKSKSWEGGGCVRTCHPLPPLSLKLTIVPSHCSELRTAHGRNYD